jgi:hypothetical protein
MSPSRGRLVEIAASTVVLAGIVQYWLWYFHRGLNLLDEGSQAAQANRLLHGDVIYRDFTTAIAPLSYYTVAALFGIFGRELMVVRYAALALGVVIFLVTLGLGRHVMTWPFAAVAATLTTTWGWILVAPNFYSWQAMAFALSALLCTLEFLSTERCGYIIGGGVLAGLAILTKQNTGAYAAASLAIVLLLFRRGRGFSAFVVATTLPVVAGVFLLVALGAGPYLYDNLIRYPFVVFRSVMALPYPPFHPLIPEAGLSTLTTALPAVITGRVPEPAIFHFWTSVALYLPVLVLPIAIARGVWLVAQRNAEAVPLVAITVFAATALLQSWPRADETHILFGMQATFVLLGYSLFLAHRALTAGLPESWLGEASTIAIMIVAIWMILAFGRAGYRRAEFQYQNDTVPITNVKRARGILTNAEEARRVEEIVGRLTREAGPSDPVLVVPWAAGLYFLADRRNPTRVDIFYDGAEAAYPCTIVALDEAQPPVVIYGYVWDIDAKHFRDYARPLDDYIRRNYAIEATLPGYEVWRRRADASRTFPVPPGRCAIDLRVARRRWK